MTLAIGAKVTTLLIEHLRATERTTFPPVFRILVVGLCWFGSLGDFHQSNITTNERGRKAFFKDPYWTSEWRHNIFATLADAT
jgi:hypothetical protein